MPIILEPQWNPLSSSRPIIFRAFYTAPDPSTVKHAEAKLYLRGSLYATFFVKPFATAPSLTPGFTEFFFDIDVHELLEVDLGISTTTIFPSVLVNPSQSGNAVNNDFFGEFYIVVSYQVLDSATGLLSAPLENEISNTFTAVAATRQHLESMDLEEFLTVLPSQLGRPLTNRILNQTICPEQNASISWFDALNYVHFTVYDLDGNLFPTPNFYSFVPGATDEQATTGIGTANLYAKTYFTGLVLPAIELISKYEVDLGVAMPIGTAINYTKVTDTYTYTINSCCDARQIRLHWINPLGGCDQYNFTGAKTLELQTQSDKGEKALIWSTTSPTPHQTIDYGQFRHSLRGRERYKLETVPLTSEEAEWLKELSLSGYVVAELEGGVYNAVNIEDGRFVIDDSTGLPRLNLQINISNERLILNL